MLEGVEKEFDRNNPGSLLGPHRSGQVLEIVAALPLASEAWVEDRAGIRIASFERYGRSYLFKASISENLGPADYLVCYRDASGYVERRHDPYAFPPQLSDFDIYLYKKGELYLSYRTLGAHLVERDAVRGVRFCVWAPNALAVSVTGNFNHWSPNSHPMVNVGNSGIWELFVPDIGENEIYKYAVTTSDGVIRLKTDPYAFRTEMRPHTGAVVTSLDYDWGDSEWMRKRERMEHRPVSIYEVHLGSWRRGEGNTFMNYRDIADQLIAYVKEQGFTHIELMPVMEHPLDASWGYQIVNYYSPTARFGAPSDLMYLIDKCHRNNIGVILDWVPAHFPEDEYGISMYDGTHLYDHEDPRKGRHPDWGTRIFNYGRNEVRNFLISNAIFWMDAYHADGIRIDAVSSMLYLDYSRKEGEWIPNVYGGRENLEAIQFMREMNEQLHRRFPGAVTVAEESTAWGGVTRGAESGGLGFDFKWNMGWMHDTLSYFSLDPIYRKYHQNTLTFTLWYAFSERFILPYSHDEVVHLKGSLINKMPGDYWQKFANLRLCFSFMYASPGKKLLFMGDEFAQWDEWREDRSLDWHLLSYEMHRKMLALVRDLNRNYTAHSQLHDLDCESAGFEWIDFNDREDSVLSFLRRDRKGREMICVFNMTPVVRHNYRVGVSRQGRYIEVFNSDAAEYGGSGVGNFGSVEADGIPMHGRAFSLNITLPPLAADFFVPE